MHNIPSSVWALVCKYRFEVGFHPWACIHVTLPAPLQAGRFLTGLVNPAVVLCSWVSERCSTTSFSQANLALCRLHIGVRLHWCQQSQSIQSKCHLDPTKRLPRQNEPISLNSRGGSLCWMCCSVPNPMLGMLTLALQGQSCDSPPPAFGFPSGILGSSAGLPVK